MEGAVTLAMVRLIGLLLFRTLAQQGPFSAVDEALERGIREGVYPGAVVMIGTSNRILHAAGYGRLTWAPTSSRPSPDSTFFDLASLTKVVATTSAAMVLVDRGRIILHEPVQRYLPEFTGEGKDLVTVRHLLEHRTGLRAFLPLHELTRTAAEARARVLAEPLQGRPGTRVVYSDLNAMILGWVIEAVTGTTLDRFVASAVFEPLAMTSTMFRPPRSLWSRVAPVGVWRSTPVSGQVHDQNAARLGGVSGHAGLFSTGADLARFAQALLAGGRAGETPRFVRSATVRAFTARREGNRALGWEVRDSTTDDGVGTRLSARAYGHGGFTGTSIWIDPDRDLFVVILTNRVFAPRTRNSISRLKAVRAAVANAAVDLQETVCRAAVAASAC